MAPRTRSSASASQSRARRIADPPPRPRRRVLDLSTHWPAPDDLLPDDEGSFSTARRYTCTRSRHARLAAWEVCRVRGEDETLLFYIPDHYQPHLRFLLYKLHSYYFCLETGAFDEVEASAPAIASTVRMWKDGAKRQLLFHHNLFTAIGDEVRAYLYQGLRRGAHPRHKLPSDVFLPTLDTFLLRELCGIRRAPEPHDPATLIAHVDELEDFDWVAWANRDERNEVWYGAIAGDPEPPSVDGSGMLPTGAWDLIERELMKARESAPARSPERKGKGKEQEAPSPSVEAKDGASGTNSAPCDEDMAAGVGGSVTAGSKGMEEGSSDEGPLNERPLSRSPSHLTKGSDQVSVSPPGSVPLVDEDMEFEGGAVEESPTDYVRAPSNAHISKQSPEVSDSERPANIQHHSPSPNNLFYNPIAGTGPRGARALRGASENVVTKEVKQEMITEVLLSEAENFATAGEGRGSWAGGDTRNTGTSAPIVLVPSSSPAGSPPLDEMEDASPVRPQAVSHAGRVASQEPREKR
ncbi:hypothetical protein BOTBODRAFT_182371 [Botryobasidium botryosum FD-172 SS1]|uniref:Uncharacterized protein n=1 Tax=Botryobasidium botryosum (strain FD-172 SS1) TaxID=930990 RepID=A0A067M221_BOTB1|nr:hypothetical protein BOTBODRAFT_182371 [Botryobasidium botryosum FD-172 SS1]